MIRLILPLAALLCACTLSGQALQVNDKEYLEAQGLNVLLYHNVFHPVFIDEKHAGMEIILHGERIATNGDLRLSPTPEQWDAVPSFSKRVPDAAAARLTALCSFPELSYKLEVTAEPGGFRMAIHLDKPLPESLAGKAGLNLEFLPSVYWSKAYLLDSGAGVFPRHPQGPMSKDFQAEPLATGRSITLAPEDPLHRISIASDTAPLSLYDGRNRAQNGWFVLRSLVPSNKTENALVWHVRPNVIPGWTRPPVIGHNQVGYHPAREKVAVLELDPKFDAPQTARLLRRTDTGDKQVFEGAVKPWGKWLRYAYAHFDFSPVREPGIYLIEYAGQRTEPFRIDKDVYSRIWQPSLDTYLAVQMDHVSVREGYRVWHGVSHQDDARQAPINTKHFDGYMQTGVTDTRFQPGEHIPGLNVGGWYDAGDFDIRTPSQNAVIFDLVSGIETFGLPWDQTTIDQKARRVEIHRPDGVPDAVQQVEHGALQILAQFKAVGHSIPGIIEPTLQQYTHLGDGASKTDNRIYSAKLGPNEIDGNTSGLPDDRWAFTNRSTALDYQSAAALAAASRVLKGYNDALAKDAFETAVRVWEYEHTHPPTTFTSFNTSGGDPAVAELRLAIELVVATKGAAPYRARLQELLPVLKQRFAFLGAEALPAIPFMDASFAAAMEASVRADKARLDADLAKNPYGVPMRLGTWGGSGGVAGFGARMYALHKAFPQIVGPEYTFRAVDYLLGTHPASSFSYVSSVGTRSKLRAYGNNRADLTFIPGGIVPGFVTIRPDFPEDIEDWPFLWGENEYVIPVATKFVLAANAADTLVK